MNHDDAGKILRASVKDLSEPLKSAVEFTLATFYQPSASQLAKNFLAGLPYEVFMARDLHDTNPELKAKIDAAYFTIVNDENSWLGLDDLPHEQWRDVIGYDGLYQVSNLGAVDKFGQVTVLFPPVEKIPRHIMILNFSTDPRKFGVNIATISEMYHGDTYKNIT